MSRLCLQILGYSPLATLCSASDLPSRPFNMNLQGVCWVAFASEQNPSFLAGPWPPSVHQPWHRQPLPAHLHSWSLWAAPGCVLELNSRPHAPRQQPPAGSRRPGPAHSVLRSPEARAGVVKGLGVNTALLFSLSEGPLCWHEFLFSWRSESSFD